MVSEGKKEWRQLGLAAVFFAISVYCVFNIVFIFFTNEITEELCMQVGKSLAIPSFCFAAGVNFSLRKSILIDLDRDKLVSRFEIGPFSRDRISFVPELEYVAVFKDTHDFYQVNLWYRGNKHYNMYFFEDKGLAMKFGKIAALKLKIDLLDATVKGNSAWIEIEKNEQDS